MAKAKTKDGDASKSRKPKAESRKPKMGGQPTRTAPPPAAELKYITPDLRKLAVPIASLYPDPKNARRHQDGDVKAIAASLEKFGQRKPVVVNLEGSIIQAGHGLVEAAKKLGWTHVAAVFVQDDADSHVGFAIADNRTAELSQWDDAVLVELLNTHGDANSDLFDALLLADLLGGDDEAGSAGATHTPPRQVNVPETWQILVECKDEDQQKELYERLVEEEFQCRIVNL